MEILQTPMGNFNVYINRLTSPQENIYHISFVDRNNKTWVVLMQRTLTGWSIINSQRLPGWIMDLQRQLFDLVSTDYLREHQSSFKE